MRILQRDVFPKCRHLVVACENRVPFPVAVTADNDDEFQTPLGSFSKESRRCHDDRHFAIVAGPFTPEGDLE